MTISPVILTITYLGGAPWSETKYRNEKLDDLIISARGELDEDKRRAIYSDVQLIIRDEGATIVPLFPSTVAGVSDRIGTPEHIGGGWEMDGGHWAKRWWLA